MANHYHLLIETPQANFSLVMRQLNSRCDQPCNRRHEWQTQAQRQFLLCELFQRNGKPARLIHAAYREFGYRLSEIAKHLGVHPATGSCRLKQTQEKYI